MAHDPAFLSVLPPAEPPGHIYRSNVQPAPQAPAQGRASDTSTPRTPRSTRTPPEVGAPSGPDRSDVLPETRCVRVERESGGGGPEGGSGQRQGRSLAAVCGGGVTAGTLQAEAESESTAGTCGIRGGALDDECCFGQRKGRGTLGYFTFIPVIILLNFGFPHIRVFRNLFSCFDSAMCARSVGWTAVAGAGPPGRLRRCGSRVPVRPWDCRGADGTLYPGPPAGETRQKAGKNRGRAGPKSTCRRPSTTCKPSSLISGAESQIWI